MFSSSVARGHIRDFSFTMAKDGTAICQKLFGNTPDTEALTHEFGGYAISENPEGVTNLIWSNGGLDPWHGGGFYPDGVLPDSSTPMYRSDETRDVHYVWIRRGAHHGDLRGATPDDPEELTAARTLEEAIIQRWIKNYV